MEDNILQQAAVLAEQVAAAHNTPLGDVVPGTPPQDAPQTIGDIPKDQFFAAIANFTGGAVKDEQTFLDRLKAAEQSQVLANKLRELEGKQALVPDIHPLADKVNAMLKSSASLSEIKKFIDFQEVDPNALDALTAYKMHIQFKYPDLTPSEADALVAETFPTQEDGNMDAKTTAKLKIEATNARQFLNEMKVAAENPAALQQRQQAEAKQKALQSGWSDVLSKTLFDSNGNPSLKGTVSHKIAEGEEYQFGYSYPKEVLKEAMSDAVAYAVQAGIPLDKDGYSAVIDLVNRFAVMRDYQNYQKALLADFSAKAMLQATKSLSGGAPPPVKQGAPPPSPDATQRRARPGDFMRP